jgi:hypothetical protein
MNKRILFMLPILMLAGCSSDADIASRNLSQAADQFEINRRIVFYNGITNDYVFVIEGLCSQSIDGKKLTVTCKTGPSAFKKHFLFLSDNVTAFSEQLEPASANTYHYRVIFKPAAIVPDIDFKK